MAGTVARGIMEDAIRRELFGPSQTGESDGKPLDCSKGIVDFADRAESQDLFYDQHTGEEIITTGTPLTRYGIGVLHGGAQMRGKAVEDDDIDLSGVSGLAHTDEKPERPPIEVDSEMRDPNRLPEPDSDDFDLTDANSFKPSAMGVSFQCVVPPEGCLEVTVTGAYYDSIEVQLPNFSAPLTWWVRRPFTLMGKVEGSELLNLTNRLIPVETTTPGTAPRIQPTTQFFSRKIVEAPKSNNRLVTMTISNPNRDGGPRSALFQMGFTVQARSGMSIEPYPESGQAMRDEEEQSLDLLYRNKRTFAIGHGCAAEWKNDTNEAAHTVEAVALPAYEVVSLTPDIYRTDANGDFILDSSGKPQPITVSMKALAANTDQGRTQVETILQLYGEWIEARRAEILSLPEQLHAAAYRHMGHASDALERMRTGWELIRTDNAVRQVFQWANEAMLYQQIRSNFELRKIVHHKDKTVSIEGEHPEPSVAPGRGNWRPFQIAFILATLPELVDPTRTNRSLVDLIFFPTGGGKTEAYLGACAISLLARRMRDPQDTGTDTIMRYTLRLLTAQQFLRASSLVCVLEDIRQRNIDVLGQDSFSIGIWVGGDTTPNNRKQALADLGKLRKDAEAPNKFLLLRCPWCGAQMGVSQKGRQAPRVVGYENIGKNVFFICYDEQCKFSQPPGLPIYVIDEDIYDKRPSIIIGTVDKFAMLSWRPQARAIFGLNDKGERDVSPPGLIIQDELHLISGPLGSMVGLYEPVIEELCTDRRLDVAVPPKIIAATATTRRYEEQIRGLFGRENVALFPPHGLEEGRSFFAEPSRFDDGTEKPGRRYLGVMSASYGSTQTVQTRVAAATLQGALRIPVEQRDGYWTNLNFFNSLRELGNTVSLLESDVPDYLTGLKWRENIDPRWPHNVLELTSRRRSDEIPKAIEQLESEYVPDAQRQEAVDICLASNIIEVGIDINRLALMTIAGQPKTTAQYIQVSGRVGRRPETSPGLVVTIYGAAKPRDRSHYERFTTYHQQLYSQVEPTSVTPFATPVLKRALHAAAIAYIRMTTPVDTQPVPFPEDAYREAIALFRDRASLADAHEQEELDRIASIRAEEWDGWERTEWDASPVMGDPLQGLMRAAGSVASEERKGLIWEVPMSMRNVDAECRLQIALRPREGNSTSEAE